MHHLLVQGGCHLTVPFPTLSSQGVLNLSVSLDKTNRMQVVEFKVGRRRYGSIQFARRGITPSPPSPVPHTPTQVQVEDTPMILP